MIYVISMRDYDFHDEMMTMILLIEGGRSLDDFDQVSVIPWFYSDRIARKGATYGRAEASKKALPNA
jgi:hypothetical protein